MGIVVFPWIGVGYDWIGVGYAWCSGYLVCCVAGFLLAGSLLLVFVFMFVLLFGVFRV